MMKEEKAAEQEAGRWLRDDRVAKARIDWPSILSSYYLGIDVCLLSV